MGPYGDSFAEQRTFRIPGDPAAGPPPPERFSVTSQALSLIGYGHAALAQGQQTLEALDAYYQANKHQVRRDLRLAGREYHTWKARLARRQAFVARWTGARSSVMGLRGAWPARELRSCWQKP